MRTTIDIEADVLLAARELTRKQKVSTDRMISRPLRAALSGAPANKTTSPGAKAAHVAGFRPFAAEGQRLVTNDQIDHLRDQTGV